MIISLFSFIKFYENENIEIIKIKHLIIKFKPSYFVNNNI